MSSQFTWDDDELEGAALEEYYRRNGFYEYDHVEYVETKCECGGFKVYGAKKGEYGHSDWCPWSPK